MFSKILHFDHDRYRKPKMFYRIFKNKSSFYLFKQIPEKTRNVTRNVDDIPLIKIKHNFFKNTFYLQSLNGTRDPLFLKLKSSN